MGAIFLAIIAHGRKHGVSLYSDDVEYIRSMLRGMIAAAFFGIPFGGLVNSARNPLYANVGGAVIGGIAAWLAPNFADRLFPIGWPEWVRAVVFIAIGLTIGACVGATIQVRKSR